MKLKRHFHFTQALLLLSHLLILSLLYQQHIATLFSNIRESANGSSQITSRCELGMTYNKNKTEIISWRHKTILENKNSLKISSAALICLLVCDFLFLSRGYFGLKQYSSSNRKQPVTVSRNSQHKFLLSKHYFQEVLKFDIHLKEASASAFFINLRYTEFSSLKKDQQTSQAFCFVFCFSYLKSLFKPKVVAL